MRHTKMHFSAKCNSGRIAIQWFHIKDYFDYQYIIIQPYTSRVHFFFFLHDTRLRFPDYKSINLYDLVFRQLIEGNEYLDVADVGAGTDVLCWCDDVAQSSIRDTPSLWYYI